MNAYDRALLLRDVKTLRAVIPSKSDEDVNLDLDADAQEGGGKDAGEPGGGGVEAGKPSVYSLAELNDLNSLRLISDADIGSWIDSPTQCGKLTPLMIAVRKGHLDMVTALLQYLLLTTYCLLLTTYCSLLTSHYSLLTTHCLLLTTCHSLFITHCLLPTRYGTL